MAQGDSEWSQSIVREQTQAHHRARRIGAWLIRDTLLPLNSMCYTVSHLAVRRRMLMTRSQRKYRLISADDRIDVSSERVKANLATRFHEDYPRIA
jgi:hypothetical protein